MQSRRFTLFITISTVLLLALVLELSIEGSRQWPGLFSGANANAATAQGTPVISDTSTTVITHDTIAPQVTVPQPTPTSQAVTTQELPAQPVNSQDTVTQSTDTQSTEPESADANETITYLASISNEVPIPAFPEAEGFGTLTPGGRGGQVFIVDTLEDSGPGSLRECIEAEMPRICVFRVAGTIRLLAPLRIENPYLTIAGQTAPGDGITLRTDPSNRRGLVTTDEEGHNVVVRYIRLRPGPSEDEADTLDGFTINTDHVVLDHVSISWAVDENVNVWTDDLEEPTGDVTISWSIISEALSNSVHPWGEHSKGMLLGNDGGYNFSVHHNLFAHNSDRNPEMKARTGGIIDVVNNVSYNYGWRNAIISDKYGIPYVNYVGNYTKEGPNSNIKHNKPVTVFELRYYKYEEEDKIDGHGLHLFLHDNRGPNRVSGSDADAGLVDPEDSELITYRSARHPAPPVTTLPAEEAFSAVLADAGASQGIDCTGQWFPRRDAVDIRVVNDVREGTGGIINDPFDVGGWPTLDPGVPCVDKDKDGMPDEWERLHFKSLAKNAAGDFDRDGYTNIEEYFNGTTP